MPEEPSMVQHPSGFLWGAAVRAAARRRFKISMQCESTFKERLKSGLEVHRVGLYEFSERKSEAQSNVEKLVVAMIQVQLAKDPRVDILDEWTILRALGDEKLCPGLWPLC
ncbi:MAG TPA: hypothetical protein VK513_03060 [Terriglobales bacterium]|nr:hypothetical protein [Terriglobales bacterium]